MEEKKEDKNDDHTSNDVEESTDGNQLLQDSHATRLQQVESEIQDLRKDIGSLQEQLQGHLRSMKTAVKEEFGHLMEEEKKLSQQRDVDASRVQQLESEVQDLRKYIQEQLQGHLSGMKMVAKEEFSPLMEEEKKSLVTGQRMQVEMNAMKLSVETKNKNELDAVSENLQQQVNTARHTSMGLQQKLETIRHDFSQQLNVMQGRIKTAQSLSFLNFCILIVLIILLAFVVVNLTTVDSGFWSPSKRQPPVKSDKEVVVKHFTHGIDELRGAFPGQSERLWRIIEAATFPVIEEDNPSHPAVILLVTGKGSESVAECLAVRYAALVSKSFSAASHATFNCESYADSDPDDAKRQLDSVLTGAFDAGSKSGVVLQVEKFPGQAPMIFYRFADNDNAPYKDVAIVLTLTLESTDTGSEKDNVAYNELRKVWGSSLDVDKVEPLLSRIGNSVAFVRPETRHTLSENGCQTRRQ